VSRAAAGRSHLFDRPERREDVSAFSGHLKAEVPGWRPPLV
jgi:hypothetical protein